MTKVPDSNPEPDLRNINAHIKFGEKNPEIYLSYCPEMKIWMYHRQITLPISNPEPDLHNINKHTKFGENPLIFTQVIVQK